MILRQPKIYKLKTPLFYMETDTITIPRTKFEELKRKAEIDEELLQELVQGLKDIKAGNVRRVR